jgi:hypothetical protein
MGFMEDVEAERMGWASYSVGSIVALGVGGGLLIVAGLVWPDLFGLPGLMMLGIGVGGFLVLWALVRAARKGLGVLEYRDVHRRMGERWRDEQQRREEWRRRQEQDQKEWGRPE